MILAASALLGYLAGSILPGSIAARLRGVRLRQEGSGNPGATNVARSLGVGWAVVVALIDIAKGVAAVALVPRILGPGEAEAVALTAAVGVVSGHLWPIFHRFRGGKGVATTLGAVLVLEPWAAAFSLAVFALVFVARRIVSLASLTAAFLLPASIAAAAVMAGNDWRGRLVFGLIGTLLIFWQHRGNLSRLRAGTERPVTRS